MSISKLVQIRIANFGCIGPEAVDIALDDIVCLVGPNNVGKSTVLRAYESAVGMADLRPEQIHANANGQPASVELWVHIPEGAENIDEKWKEHKDGLLLVRSKWEWPATGGRPTRRTWDPEAQEYADNGKASGLDTVFNSRLPKPFRIGALEDPTEEHRKLLELVLEPIKTRLNSLVRDEASELCARLKALQVEAEKPVAEFRGDLDKVQTRVNTSYQRVFNTGRVQLSVSLGNLSIDPSAALMKESGVQIVEPHGPTRWSQQGTGSQRALFWSMLEVRSELNRIANQRKQDEKATKDKVAELKKLQAKLPTLKRPATQQECAEAIRKLEEDLQALQTHAEGDDNTPDAFLPGYMLLIEEPETAMHPSAIRAAKEHLYSLAAESGWQVMLSTHHPVFVDPLKDHTTVVRLNRPEAHEAPHVYRADEMHFTPDDRDNLKRLLAFDTGMAEMFFGPRVIIVEGDTEYAAFGTIMDEDPTAFPISNRPLILRARGKAAIPTLVRMLTHFKVDFTILHDIDAPRTEAGRANSAYTVNTSICTAVSDAQRKGLHVTHRCSCPNFEQHHGMTVPSKDKPFMAWRIIRAEDAVRASVRGVLDELLGPPGNEPATQCFNTRIRTWAQAHAPADPLYTFDA